MTHDEHDSGVEEIDCLEAIDRITSYNVCYTKLLRPGRHRALFAGLLGRRALLLGGPDRSGSRNHGT